MRRRAGGTQMDIGAMREALADGKVWAGLGIVVKREGDSAHYEIADGDVMVEVDLMPHGEPLLCRLASAGGLWRVPPEGSEVCVLLNDGAIDGEPMIVGMLSGGEVDDDLDADTLLIVNSDKVVIKSIDDKVILGGTDGKDIARKGDHVDLGTFSHTPASGTFVTPCQLIYTPPGGGTPVPITSGGVNITQAEINEGSSKAQAAD